MAVGATGLAYQVQHYGEPRCMHKDDDVCRLDSPTQHCSPSHPSFLFLDLMSIPPQSQDWLLYYPRTATPMPPVGQHASWLPGISVLGVVAELGRPCWRIELDDGYDHFYLLILVKF